MYMFTSLPALCINIHLITYFPLAILIWFSQHCINIHLITYFPLAILIWFSQHYPCQFSLQNCMLPLYICYVRNGNWLLLLFLFLAAVHLISGSRTGSVSSIPTHSNFFRALSRGRQRVLWCQDDPIFCSNHNKNPWGGSVCCFGKSCKDVMADRNHCGECGHVCRYELVCCDGKCVDIRNDPRHCGGCFEECHGQGSCAYAMCDYG